MTEDEKQAIRASFAGKKVSQMTELERKVFDQDFQYGVAGRSSQMTVAVKGLNKGQSTLSSILRRLGLNTTDLTNVRHTSE